MQTQIQDLLQKEVSRKEFLRHLGIGLISIMGLSTLVKLSGYKHHDAHGYGSSPYGR